MSYQMRTADVTYAEILKNLYEGGVERGFGRPTRPGVNTVSAFGSHVTLRNVGDAFPIVGLKTINWPWALAEILWMLRGESNVKWLQEQGCHSWDPWASSTGELGPVYGVQWRFWESTTGTALVDQLQECANSLATDPFGRRHIMTCWNPGELDQMALPPCHGLPVQFLAQHHPDDGFLLHISVYQRSCDAFIGMPFNWVHYAVLAHIMCSHLRVRTGNMWNPACVYFAYGDLHLYENHAEAASQLLSRYQVGLNTKAADDQVRLKVGRFDTLDPHEFTMDKFELVGYDPMGYIKAPVAV